jgi:hypothetical protein
MGSPVYDAGSEYREVTPERFSRLEKELVRGKGENVSNIIVKFAEVLF